MVLVMEDVASLCRINAYNAIIETIYSETPRPGSTGQGLTGARTVLNVVYFETPFSSARGWSIWANAYVTLSAVVIVSPFRASDS